MIVSESGHLKAAGDGDGAGAGAGAAVVAGGLVGAGVAEGAWQPIRPLRMMATVIIVIDTLLSIHYPPSFLDILFFYS